MDETLGGWLKTTIGRRPSDPALFARALTHASRSDEHYERLEFLGDRVLGLIVGAWLYRLFPDEPEGKLSDRFHALVSGEVCAEIARELDVPAHLKLGKQAQDDGVFQSDNVLGDVTEALIGALWLDAGYEAAESFVRRAWGDRVDRLSAPPKHPKAALQEWTAAHKRKPPAYTLVGIEGPNHAPRFTIAVKVNGVGEAQGIGLSKQEAETEAAKAMLGMLK